MNNAGIALESGSSKPAGGEHKTLSSAARTPQQADLQVRAFFGWMQIAFSMLSFLAFSFGLWAMTAQMNRTSGFLFSSGPLSNWLIWIAAALIMWAGGHPPRRSERLTVGSAPTQAQASQRRGESR